MCTIPSSWKSKIKEFGNRLPVVKSQNIERLLKTKRVTSFTYNTLRKSVATQPTRVQCKWNKHLPSPVEYWSTYYSIPFLCTSASKQRIFQYEIFYRIIGTNVLLMKMGIKDHDDCFFVTVNLNHRAPLLVLWPDIPPLECPCTLDSVGNRNWSRIFPWICSLGLYKLYAL